MISFKYIENYIDPRKKKAKEKAKSNLRETNSIAIDKTSVSKKDLLTIEKINKAKEYKKKVDEEYYQKQKTEIVQDNRSEKAKKIDQKAMDKATSKELTLELPLLYLSNPEKFLGDALNSIGWKNNFDTTEEDREKIMLNRYNPYQSSEKRFETHLGYGLEEVPSATINTALSLFPYGRLTGKKATPNITGKKATSSIAGKEATSSIAGNTALSLPPYGGLTGKEAISKITGKVKKKTKKEIVEEMFEKNYRDITNPNSEAFKRIKKYYPDIEPSDFQKPGFDYSNELLSHGSRYTIRPGDSDIYIRPKNDKKTADKLGLGITPSPDSAFEHEWMHYLIEQIRRKEFFKRYPHIKEINDNNFKLYEDFTKVYENNLQKKFENNFYTREFFKENINSSDEDIINYFFHDEEFLPHFSEMRRNMLNAGLIKNKWDLPSEEVIQNFIEKNQSASKIDRVSSVLNPKNKDVVKEIQDVFKELYGVTGAAVISESLINNQSHAKE